MAALRSTAVVALALAAAAVLVSGGSDADPRTPPPLPGLPRPFLGTAVSGDGGMTAALDAYGDVVDLRPSPAGPALIDNPAARQAAGTVPADTGIVPRVRIGGGPALPLWRADSVRQSYLAGTNVVRTVAQFGAARVVETAAASGGALAVRVTARWAGEGQGGGAAPVTSVSVDVGGGARCDARGGDAELTIVCAAGSGAADPGPSGDTKVSVAANLRRASTGDRRWLGRARPLGPGAPRWARAMYRRSLLVLHALTERRSGAVAAGARDGWAYVWPRDAATAALAYAAAGYRGEARRVARFLLRLGGTERQADRGGAAPAIAAARFEGDGSPVPGRGPQGDAAGWIAVAARAAGLRPLPRAPGSWRELPDYQEGAPGDYLGNAIAAAGIEAGGNAADAGSASSAAPRRAPAAQRLHGASLSAPASRRAEQTLLRGFAASKGLVRRADDPGSGLDSAAAWAVRPFDLPALRPAAERTLLALAWGGGRFGITPGTGWSGGGDPWAAPTAAAAWSLAALSREAGQRPVGIARAERGHPVSAARDHAAALRLLADLRRAATSAGALPERVDARTGVPSSTTPLAWPHAFAVLTLRELWPDHRCIDRGCHGDQK